MLSWVEHEKSFITAGPELEIGSPIPIHNADTIEEAAWKCKS